MEKPLNRTAAQKQKNKEKFIYKRSRFTNNKFWVSASEIFPCSFVFEWFSCSLFYVCRYVNNLMIHNSHIYCIIFEMLIWMKESKWLSFGINTIQSLDLHFQMNIRNKMHKFSNETSFGPFFNILLLLSSLVFVSYC